MTLSSALIAFGHFIAFFEMASALTLQIALVKPSTFSETDSANLRRFLHYQLIGICIVLFCASMMAKGFGSFT